MQKESHVKLDWPPKTAAWSWKTASPFFLDAFPSLTTQWHSNCLAIGPVSWFQLGVNTKRYLFAFSSQRPSQGQFKTVTFHLIKDNKFSSNSYLYALVFCSFHWLCCTRDLNSLARPKILLTHALYTEESCFMWG